MLAGLGEAKSPGYWDSAGSGSGAKPRFHSRESFLPPSHQALLTVKPGSGHDEASTKS